jgi:O-antigen ligase
MIEYIKKHYQFAILLIIWVVSGIWGGPAYLGIIPLSVILLKSKGMYVELICGLIFILVLSDSWNLDMLWAGNVKDIYLVLLSLFFFFNQKEFPQKNNLFYPYIPFFILASILILRSPDPVMCFQKTLSYILVFTTLPPYFNKLLAEEPDRFLKGLVYTGTVLLLYGFPLIAVDFDTAYLAGRYRGVMGNPNGLGIFCTVFFALFTIIIDKYKNLFSKPETVFIYITIMLSVVLSGSRNTLISILVFYGFSRFFKISYWLGFGLIIIIGITYQLVISNLPAIIHSMGLETYMRVDHLEDGSGRIVAWIFGWKKVQENFLFGRGFNFEGWLYQQYADYLYTLGHIGNSHNSYLATWLNTGLVGLVLFLGAMIYRFVTASAYSHYALPLMYCVIFSAMFEAWLVGSLNPHTPLLLLMWTIMMVAVPQQEVSEMKIKSDRFKIPELIN